VMSSEEHFAIKMVLTAYRYIEGGDILWLQTGRRLVDLIFQMIRKEIGCETGCETGKLSVFSAIIIWPVQYGTLASSHSNYCEGVICFVEYARHSSMKTVAD